MLILAVGTACAFDVGLGHLNEVFVYFASLREGLPTPHATAMTRLIHPSNYLFAPLATPFSTICSYPLPLLIPAIPGLLFSLRIAQFLSYNASLSAHSVVLGVFWRHQYAPGEGPDLDGPVNCCR